MFLLAVATVRADDRPPAHVILIVSDDQGYSDLGCLGAKPIRTPHLDRLAAEGVRVTDFYVTWPACTPSRGSLLTGRYPQRNGLYDMIRNDLVNYGHRYTEEDYAVSPEMTLGLDVREVTLGDVLAKAGYHCGMVGKWDMGQAKRFLPLQRGFASFYGHGNNGIDYYTHERYGIPSMFRGNSRVIVDRGTYATRLFEREAVEFIQEAAAGDKPFFLYLCFNAPHSASSYAGPEGIAKTGVQAPPEEVVSYRDQGLAEKLATYYAAMTRMDEAVGKVMRALEEKNLSENTLILFLSDNGGSGNGGNAPLRGGKGTLWEGGLRVPFIASWPARLPRGKVCTEFLTSLEVLPTLCAATGAALPDGVVLDGFDMLPVLRGDAASPRQSLFCQRRGDKAARVGRWKWVDSAKGSGLFDLDQDLGEKHDLSDQHPEVLQGLRDQFAKWRAEMDKADPRGPFRDY
jgi:arylsulfatase A-like enzyme